MIVIDTHSFMQGILVGLAIGVCVIVVGAVHAMRSKPWL